MNKDLFGESELKIESSDTGSTEKLTRLDIDENVKKKILPYCRLKTGEIWEDPEGLHRVGVLDATEKEDILRLCPERNARLILNDPPYNIVVGNLNTKNLSKNSLANYIDFCRKWITNSIEIMDKDASLYIWMGADQNDGFQPLPDFMIMMREMTDLRTRSFITMRNQRGYGTQKNWMAVRQELLYYVKGNPVFNIDAEYTDIPKILGGYYKKVNGMITDNFERSKSPTIRAGNVWVDIQQVFYRMEENVPGCYAQKPLKSTERIISSSTNEDDVVVDMFSHSGSTLISCERLKRKCFTMDNDPVFAEMTIRRLENLRKHGKTGWQWQNPFPEIGDL